MARFYDSTNNGDLNRVEAILQEGGIEYFVRELEDGSSVQEIDVAEEDTAYAELLLNSSSEQRTLNTMS